MSEATVNAEEKPTAAAYFKQQRDCFIRVASDSSLVSRLAGGRVEDPRRVFATWLFIRACVTAKSIERLLLPQPTENSEISYLDHASISSLARGLIENIAVLLYVGDSDISDAEWQCRKQLIDLHDYRTRHEFLTLLGVPSDSESPSDTFRELKRRLKGNSFFLHFAGPTTKETVECRRHVRRWPFPRARKNRVVGGSHKSYLQIPFDAITHNANVVPSNADEPDICKR